MLAIIKKGKDVGIIHQVALMKGKRFLSVILVAVMLVTGVTTSFTALAEERMVNGSDVAIENSELTSESTNSLGDLFSDQ